MGRSTSSKDERNLTRAKKKISIALATLKHSKGLEKMGCLLWKHKNQNDITCRGFYQNDSCKQIRGYVTVNKLSKTIILSFLGTKNIRDLVYDFKFKRIYSPFECIQGKIHYGFYRMYEECFIEVNRTFDRWRKKYPDYTMIITGHSLGAAMALFHSIYLVRQGCRFSLVFFCIPKIGNSEFDVNYLKLLQDGEIPIHNVRNRLDPVIRLPPTIFGYESIHRYNYSNEDFSFKKLRFKSHILDNLAKDLEELIRSR